MESPVFAPGARLLVRDAEWIVRRVDRTSTGGYSVKVVGVSELVRNKNATFLTEIDKSISVLDPVDTKLVQDTSSAFQGSLLFLEGLLRQTPPTDERIYIGHNAAMDAVPYQMDPAIQALRQPRQRILIADAVGLGKTLEAGILLSELIRRGRANRILVVAIKSMLTQFQKELWSRFTIPLTRLDSVGIQRIRSRIPTNHNPFYYYDKAIISIDTLKQDAEYRTYLENAFWDVIVIDEAQNVAERGTARSLRSRLAKLLATRSDTLIMLSATPHDGQARSFASLMNMLDPTAIADPEEYGPDDIKGLFIRRFKMDIQEQVQSAFKERRIGEARAAASAEEETAFNSLASLRFERINTRDNSGKLFKTTLQKALFSSPAACLQTIGNRIKTLEKKADSAFDRDIAALQALASDVNRITVRRFSKYQRLVSVLTASGNDWAWSGRDTSDRLVIFTERIETLRFLHEHLPRDLGLSAKQVRVLYGSLSDQEQQTIVEEFGKDESPVRLLIASDVASEGINLHFLCHRMIHFDIPWSLMVFQQRNGRIDRYGQESVPQILYLITDSQNEKIRGDTRILEVLIRKDEQAVKNIGDPSALMGVYDVEQEEKRTAEAMEQGLTDAEFEKTIERPAVNLLDILLASAESPKGEEALTMQGTLSSLFQDDYSYVRIAIQFLGESKTFQAEVDPDRRMIAFTASDDLKDRFKLLPGEIWPEGGRFWLCSDKQAMQRAIRESRKEERSWPKIHYLWGLNPVVEWINDQVLAHFGRHEAPVLTLPQVLRSGEIVFLMSGLIPNLKGHPLFERWFGVVFSGSDGAKVENFSEILDRTGLGKSPVPNPNKPVNLVELQTMLPDAVRKAREWVSVQCGAFQEQINDKLYAHLEELERLKKRRLGQLKKRLAASRQPESVVRAREEKEMRDVEALFDEYIKWAEETMSTEDNPYLRIVAVLKGDD